MYELTVYWDEGRDALLNIKSHSLEHLDQLVVDAIGFSLRVRVYSYHPTKDEKPPVQVAEYCGPRVQYTLARIK